jgi:hypothetical protein
MLGHVEVNYSTPIVQQDLETVEQPKADRRYDEEVDRGQTAPWLRRNRFQVYEGGFRSLGMYLATVDSAMSWPGKYNST